MAKGGARLNTGRVPSPDALRPNRAANAHWRDLPAAGYQGAVPPWPFEDSEPRELLIWAKIWRTPQASAWVDDGVWAGDIASLVRLMLKAERGDMKAAAEYRQWNDRLGLNPDAMLRKRWRLTDEAVAATAVVAPVKRSSSRSRLKVVSGGDS